MLSRVKFSVSPPGGDRIHHVNEEDVRVVLSRLPYNLWRWLRAVHFNDSGLLVRIFGYVQRGRREITLCALPPRMSPTKVLRGGETPEEFGAKRGQKWPPLAIRRFMLYDVFLHELGHLQLINDRSRSDHLRFAHEKLAQAFAMDWRRQLWSEPFPHPDPVHNPPSAEELEAVSQAPDSKCRQPQS